MHLINEIIALTLHEPFYCTIANMDIVNDVRKGLKSEFLFECKFCRLIKVISAAREANKVSINEIGIISTGIGRSQCIELMTVPFMSIGTFINKQERVSEWITEAAWSTIKDVRISCLIRKHRCRRSTIFIYYYRLCLVKTIV